MNEKIKYLIFGVLLFISFLFSVFTSKYSILLYCGFSFILYYLDKISNHLEDIK